MYQFLVSHLLFICLRLGVKFKTKNAKTFFIFFITSTHSFLDFSLGFYVLMHFTIQDEDSNSTQFLGRIVFYFFVPLLSVYPCSFLFLDKSFFHFRWFLTRDSVSIDDFVFFPAVFSSYVFSKSITFFWCMRSLFARRSKAFLISNGKL